MKITHCFLVLALIGCVYASPVMAMDLLEMTPDQPILFLGLDGDALDIDWESTNFVKQIEAAPYWDWILAKIQAEAGLQSPQIAAEAGMLLISRVLSGELVIALPDFQMFTEISPLVMFDMPAEDDLGKLLQSGLRLAMANVPDASTWTHHDHAVTEAAVPDMPMKLNATVLGDVFVVGLGRAGVQEVIELYEQQGLNSLSNNAAFMAGHTALGGETTMAFHVDLARARELAGMFLPMAMQQAPPQIPMMVQMAMKWLDLVPNITAWQGISEEGLVSYQHVSLNPEATSQNFLAMIQAEPQEMASLRYVPADVFQYGATTQYSLPGIWEMLKGVAQEIPPLQPMPAKIEEMEAQLNIDIEEEIFGWMGREIGIISSDTAMQMNGPQSNQQIPEEMALFVAVADRELAQASISKFYQMGAGILQMAGEDASAPQLEMHEYQEQTIFTFTIPELPITPACALTDDFFILSADVAYLKHLLDVAAGETESVESNPRYQELADKIPAKVNALGFTDFQRLGEGIAEQVTEQLAQVPDFEAHGYEVMFAQQLVDTIEALTPALGASIEITELDPQGYHTTGLMTMHDLPEVVEIPDPPEAQFARALDIAKTYADAGRHDEALRHADHALELQPGHWQALLQKSDVLEEQGERAAARALRRQVGFVEEPFWHIVGPFDNTDGSGYETIYPPEDSVDLNAELDGLDGKVAWEIAPGNDGRLEFSEPYGEAPWALAYAYTEIMAEEEQEVHFRIGTDDDAKLWLNDELIFEFEGGRAAYPDQDTVTATLQAGTNRILVKVCNQEYKWGLYLRITDADGHSLVQLTDGETPRIQ